MKDWIDFAWTDVPQLFRWLLIQTVLGMAFSAAFVITDGIFVGHGPDPVAGFGLSGGMLLRATLVAGVPGIWQAVPLAEVAPPAWSSPSIRTTAANPDAVWYPATHEKASGHFVLEASAFFGGSEAASYGRPSVSDTVSVEEFSAAEAFWKASLSTFQPPPSAL